MPIQRPPTPEEAEWYKQQGIDPSTVTITDSSADIAKEGDITPAGAVARTAKAHIGGYLGGAGGLALGAALAPETGGLSFIIPILSAFGGGVAGQKLQDVVQGEQLTQELQQKAAEASEQHPVISGATDIGLSALLSGGKPSISNIPKAARGLVGKGLSEADQLAFTLPSKGVTSLSEAGAESLANRKALAKVAMSSLVNPAINTGINYALTGEAPSVGDIASQVAGGALFSNQSRLGRMLMGHSPNIPSTAPEPSGEPTGVVHADSTDPFQQTTPKQSPYTLKNESGEYEISDSQIPQAYRKYFPKPQLGQEGSTYEQDLMAANQYKKSLGQPVDKLRQTLHDTWLANQPKEEGLKVTTGGNPFPVAEQEQQEPSTISRGLTLSDRPTPKGLIENAKTNLTDANKEKPFTQEQANAEFADELNPKAPTETSRTPDQILQDRQEYESLNQKMKALIQQGNIQGPEMQEVWKAFEAVRNKYGGMPPPSTGQPKAPTIIPVMGRNTGGVMEHIINDNATVKSVLEKIAANKDSEYAPIAQHILNSGIDPSKFSIPINRTNKTYSSYSPSENKVSITMPHLDNHAIIMHEIAHALTSNHIPREFFNHTGEALKQKMDEYLANEKGDKNVKELIHSYYDALNKTGFADRIFKNGFDNTPQTLYNSHGALGYGMANLHEFIAMALSHEGFQEHLNNMESSRKGVSIWTRMFNAIRNILGVPVNQESVLAKVLHSSEQIARTPLSEGDQSYATKNRLKQTHYSDEHSGIDKERLSSETGGRDSLQQSWEVNFPKEEEGKEVIRNTKAMGKLGEVTRSVTDKIRNQNHPEAIHLADAFDKAAVEKQQIFGRTFNKLKQTADKLGITDADQKNLQKISFWKNQHPEQPIPVELFQNDRQRQMFAAERAVYKQEGLDSVQNGPPVIRNGVPTTMRPDQASHPTTMNPAISEVRKTGTDTAAIEKQNQQYMDYAKERGLTEEEAHKNLTQIDAAIKGNLQSGTGNLQHYNALRMAQGIHLPPEWTRPGYLANLEAYYNRVSADKAFHHQIESKPNLMSALGETHDAWNRPIPKDPTGGIARNPAVSAALDNIRGEIGGQSFHNEKAVAKLATTLFVSNPVLEMHKIGTNIIGTLDLVDSPSKKIALLSNMVKNFGSGLQHAIENGVYKMTASSFKDFFNSNLTMAQRLNSLGRAYRNISSIGDWSNKFSTGLMQAGAEWALPQKIARANAGDVTEQQFLKKVDPSYSVGKTYSPDDISKLASSAIGYIHGTGDARTMPGWMLKDTELSGFFQLAHWSVAQTNRFVNDLYAPATKGNYVPLINGIFGAAIGGYIIKQLREELQGKKGQIPSLTEIAASDRGLEGNKGLIAYNLIAAAQYSGFGGLLSQVMKYPFDFAYKNTPQGATFPLDEISSNLVTTLHQVSSAIANDTNINWMNLAKEVVAHTVTGNVQLGRVAFNQLVNHNLLTGSLAEKKELADKMGQLRRFNMAEGLPYTEADTNAGNPFMDLEQKQFKRTQDLGEAAKMLPSLVSNIMEKWKSNPDVMMEKLKALKQHTYETFPSFESTPLSFMKYLGFLQKTEGPQEAQTAMMDYMKHQMLGQAKASIVP